ncbi:MULTISPECIES: hypothetical protein [Lysinibacillus]|uniref:hypothetical protein n=1 Tax=Lysinibacillus TaxID=400634 RepID=UPI001CBDE52A|nr:hypothetical protein [Lysinibacillus sphaericus]
MAARDPGAQAKLLIGRPQEALLCAKVQRQQQCFICAKVQRQQQQSAQSERKSTPRYNYEPYLWILKYQGTLKVYK